MELEWKITETGLRHQIPSNRFSLILNLPIFLINNNTNSQAKRLIIGPWYHFGNFAGFMQILSLAIQQWNWFEIEIMVLIKLKSRLNWIY